MISTSIKLDGEAEFKKQLSDVNSSLKATNSEMNYVTEAFKGQANSLEALTEKDRLLRQALDQTNDKILASEEFLEEAQKAQKSFADAIEAAEKKATSQGISLEKLHGDTKKLTDDEKELAKELLNAENAYVKATKAIESTSSTLNKTRIDQIKFNRELEDNSKYLDEARHSADKTAKSIDGFGREVANVDDQTAGFGRALGGVVSDLGKLKGAIAGGAAVAVIKEIGSSIMELEESTREYRQIMSGLIDSGEQVGIAAEQTKARYMTLQGVMNDTQAAAEATAQLQTLAATEEQLDEATISVIGAWTKLGGAAPIETIAESISQTVAAAQATGAFSDILMATGQSEDEFNEKLAASADASARLDLILQTLAATGMHDLGESYLANNEAAIKSNQSQERLNASYAALGETVAPVADLLRNVLATGLEFATEKVDASIKAVQELNRWWGETRRSLSEMSQWNAGDVWNALTTVPGLESQNRAASVTGGLTGAELREQNLRAADIVSAQQAASRAATSASEAMDRRGSFSATITLATEDGRNLGQYVTPFVNEENAANPPVRSDPF